MGYISRIIMYVYLIYSVVEGDGDFSSCVYIMYTSTLFAW